MVVNDGASLFDIVGNWLDRRRAAKLARRKAKATAQRKALTAKAPPAAKRKASKRTQKIRTAKDHRRHYGASPALRVIPGGKA